MYKYFILFATIFVISCNKNTNQIKNETLTPFEKLKAGNKRFVSGYPIHPDETLKRIRELKKGQNPFAVVVSCSDSRIPPELVFDQGLGDIFTIRTAGNVIGDYELGSIEYAVEHLGCKLIVVLGHENCGAIDAFLHSNHHRDHNHIQNIIDYISKEKEQKIELDSIKANPDLAIRANIKHGLNVLNSSKPILNKHIKNKTVKIIGAYYDLDSGLVTFDEN
jgi:carbonic anhydrase